MSINEEQQRIAQEAHDELVSFLKSFKHATRGSMYDFLLMLLANIFRASTARLDTYLAPGHENVNGNEVCSVAIDGAQSVIDHMRRNMENLTKDIRFH